MGFEGMILLCVGITVACLLVFLWLLTSKYVRWGLLIGPVVFGALYLWPASHTPKLDSAPLVLAVAMPLIFFGVLVTFGGLVGIAVHLYRRSHSRPHHLCGE